MLLKQKGNNMNKRQVKPGEWVKATEKETGKIYKGKFVEMSLPGICLEMDTGEKELFALSHFDFDFLHRDWQEVNHEDVVCRVESEDEFVTFEVRKIENVYDLYMILGYNGKMLLKEFFDLEEAKEYAEIYKLVKN